MDKPEEDIEELINKYRLNNLKLIEVLKHYRKLLTHNRELEKQSKIEGKKEIIFMRELKEDLINLKEEMRLMYYYRNNR
jgi:hypothetical protein